LDLLELQDRIVFVFVIVPCQVLDCYRAGLGMSGQLAAAAFVVGVG
jgi:hypothetical protein